MKKSKIVSMALTDEEFEKFMEALLDAESRLGKRINVSTFLKDTFFANIDGDSPPSIQDSEESEPKNVSPSIADTFEKQSDEFNFDFDES